MKDINAAAVQRAAEAERKLVVADERRAQHPLTEERVLRHSMRSQHAATSVEKGKGGGVGIGKTSEI